mmetsp:Transcript_32595/g.68864  ORF Transcript_32595/g.68864 Transcript_32595/m.68864 type:complete len:601 (+) Transcript_32595:74-1876(+)
MSNAQDLLSILNAANATRPSRGGAGGTSASGNAETSILSFKAGKMNTSLKPNGKYLVEPDGRRGELHVVWIASASSSASATSSATTSTTTNNNVGGGGTLQLQWKDRRTKTVVNTIPVYANEDATFERVETGRDGDRVYLLQSGSENRHFFWMQDKDAGPDEDLCVKVNLYLSDHGEAASAAVGDTENVNATSSVTTSATSGGGGEGGMDNAELLRIMQGALGSQNPGLEGARTTTVPGSESIPTANAGQIDALGNILENLGMPHPNDAPAGEHSVNATANAGGGGASSAPLTLEDLQGAMAGLQTQSSVESSGGEDGGNDNEEEKTEEEGKDDKEEETKEEAAEAEDAKMEEETTTKEDAKENESKGSSGEEPTSETSLIVLIAEGVYDMVQASNQRDALRLLGDLNIPYEKVDGMDPAMREKRNAFFEISGIRGNYPQFFSSAGGGDDATNTAYLGGYDWLNSTGLEDLKAIVPAAVKAASGGKASASGSASDEVAYTSRLTLLIANGVYDMVQASHQRDAMRLLDDLTIPYETVDGMDPDMREKRNSLFETSGIRGNYPQIFVSSKEGDDGAFQFLGGYEWLNGTNADELKKILGKK